MTRQQDITYQQVQARISDADKRVEQWIDSAMQARSAEDYDYALKMIKKAIDDRNVWKQVLEALEQ